MYQAPATSSWNGAASALHALEKVPTGRIGLDEVLSGGLPRSRPTLVSAAPGCGKTLFGMLAIDPLKSEGISAVMTSLTPSAATPDEAQGASSRAVDTWILVNTFERNGQRNRDLRVLASRGISHSNQVREFVSTCRGSELLDVYAGPGAVLIGCARAKQEAADKRASLLSEQEVEQKRHALQRRQALHREQLALQAECESVFERARSLSALERADEQTILDRVTMAWRRQADAITSVDHGSGGKP